MSPGPGPSIRLGDLAGAVESCVSRVSGAGSAAIRVAQRPARNGVGPRQCPASVRWLKPRRQPSWVEHTQTDRVGDPSMVMAGALPGPSGRGGSRRTTGIVRRCSRSRTTISRNDRRSALGVADLSRLRLRRRDLRWHGLAVDRRGSPVRCRVPGVRHPGGAARRSPETRGAGGGDSGSRVGVRPPRALCVVGGDRVWGTKLVHTGGHRVRHRDRHRSGPASPTSSNARAHRGIG